MREIEALTRMYMPLITVYLVNPFDMIDVNMEEVGNDKWFVSSFGVESGEFRLIKDEVVKYDLIEFCLLHPDRVWKGKKGIANEIGF